MKIAVNIDDSFMNELKLKLKNTQAGCLSNLDIMRDAFALYKWALEETNHGRIILSADGLGKNPIRVII